MEHVYQLDMMRATSDIDFAIAVSSWEEFARMKAELVATGLFAASDSPQRLIFGSGSGVYPLDLVPFGGVERDGKIAWPPDCDFVMNITGYSDAHKSALDVEIEPGFQVKVVSFPAMVILKILAWNDQPNRNKDVSDVLLILQNYSRTGQSDRLFADDFDLLEKYHFDPDLAGAALLGRDSKREVAPETRAQVLDVFANAKKMEKFDSQLMRFSDGSERATLFFDAFLHEFRA
ncbi:MAG TPA: nucleotidyl transferase AbiEii/AbiGii toxin family protein [Telluria sp.]